ncbi:MAG: hypothetical protein ABIN89_02155 [Chitinophagaceae bacterium]
MVKTEIKVKPELTEDSETFIPYLHTFVSKINYNYGRKLSLHSWEVDIQEDDEIQNLRTVVLSLQ